MFSNQDSDAQIARSALASIVVQFATFTTMTPAKNSSTAKVAVYAELAGERASFIVTLVMHVFPLK